MPEYSQSTARNIVSDLKGNSLQLSEINRAEIVTDNSIDKESNALNAAIILKG